MTPAVPSGRCGEHSERLPELALGTLPGRERADLLAHLAGCSSCSRELESLSRTADSLVAISPEVDPPPGFELKVLDRLRGPRSRPRIGARRRWAILLAVVVAVAGAVGLAASELSGQPAGTGSRAALTAPWRSSGFATSPGGHLSAASLSPGASLSSAGGPRGEIYLYQGGAPWLFMTLEASRWSGRVTCEVTFSDGSTSRVGSFWMSSGHGAWGSFLPSGHGQVREAQVLGPDGAVLASATLHSPA